MDRISVKKALTPRLYTRAHIGLPPTEMYWRVEVPSGLRERLTDHLREYVVTGEHVYFLYHSEALGLACGLADSVRAGDLTYEAVYEWLHG